MYGDVLLIYPIPSRSLGWVPLLCVVTAVFGIFLGAHPVPYCLAAEYFPTSIRGQVGVSFLKNSDFIHDRDTFTFCICGVNYCNYVNLLFHFLLLSSVFSRHFRSATPLRCCSPSWCSKCIVQCRTRSPTPASTGFTAPPAAWPWPSRSSLLRKPKAKILANTRREDTLTQRRM